MTQTITFNQILELIETLSIEEQEDLINIIRHRQIETKREEIAENIRKSAQEYEKGQVFRGNIDEVITELNQGYNIKVSYQGG